MKDINQPEDSWLVEKYLSGHSNALTVLVKRWHVKLCKQAYWYTKDYESAKDIAQDSWKVIIEKLHNLKEPKKFGSWVLSIVTNRSIDWIRKQDIRNKRNEFYIPELIDDTEEKINNSSNTSKVARAIEELPDNQQIVIKLFYIESFTIIQISKLLKVSKGTVKSRLFYAREKLKSTLKHKNHE
jgi:RNA polymerase sigma-70 factor (ECF subfamily)